MKSQELNGVSCDSLTRMIASKHSQTNEQPNDSNPESYLPQFLQPRYI